MNTKDISKFGYRELAIAGELLSAYADNPNILEGDNITLEFNMDSGNVFIVDDDYNVAMMNGDTLEQFYTCPYCGHEGFLEDMEHETQDDDCTDYINQINV